MRKKRETECRDCKICNMNLSSFVIKPQREFVEIDTNHILTMIVGLSL